MRLYLLCGSTGLAVGYLLLRLLGLQRLAVVPGLALRTVRSHALLAKMSRYLHGTKTSEIVIHLFLFSMP